MPLLFIATRNATYYARDDGHEYDSPAAAMVTAVGSAANLAADEVRNGARSVAVQVTIEDADGIRLLANVVSLSVSPLFIGREG